MKTYQGFATAREVAEVASAKTTRTELVKTKHVSPYTALLHAPTASLASNVSDRADVFFVAILGYN